MKKMLVLSVILFIFAFTGCDKKEIPINIKETNVIKQEIPINIKETDVIKNVVVIKNADDIKNADNVVIFYGLSSYAMAGCGENTLKTLLNCFNNLKFVTTDKQMDIPTKLSIYFAKEENQIAEVSVDKNGVFWLNGSTNCLKIASGTFNYNDVKDIYEKSKTKQQ